jgi:hypothetical protein
MTTDTGKTVSHVTLDCNLDGSGTMILPAGSFQVLRVKEIFHTIDSSFTWNGNGHHLVEGPGVKDRIVRSGMKPA